MTDVRQQPLMAWPSTWEPPTSASPSGTWSTAPRLSGRVGLNPQSYYGADVMTRLIAATESPDNARRIARIALDAIREALLLICTMEGFNPRAVTHVAVVGNTPMLALLTEADPRVLLQPGSWTQPLECRPQDPRAWAAVLGIHPQATVEVIAPMAGFVGSDLLTGALATGLTTRPRSLLIDFGTNSEMALWDGKTLWVTSAAGGPAFEGCQGQCGMPAEAGAVLQVDRQGDSRELLFQVIGGGEAKGLCGSGLVDLIACLRSTGDLTSLGRFTDPMSQEVFVPSRNSPALRLSRVDVDMFQRAKAAIGAGIKTLLATAQVGTAELSRVCVCGVFGQHLNSRNAQAVGLLPAFPPQRVELCGNTALAGCERLILSAISATDLALLRQQTTVINLAQTPDFDRLFLESLYLEPMRG